MGDSGASRDKEPVDAITITPAKCYRPMAGTVINLFNQGGAK
jgi:hypothetical protein